MKIIVAVPFTGLGLYNGFRGNRWLKNRIQVFEQFTIPSLLNQSDKDFVMWVQWRPEERHNKYVKALQERLKAMPFPVVFTYGGVCMYDDKYEDAEARDRLFNALRISTQELFDYLPGTEDVIHLLQPSDDCYHKDTVALIRKVFSENSHQAISYVKGYLCNYITKEVVEYNPATNPPFAAIRFPRDVFFHPGKHMAYISLKEDTEKYAKGTPLPSHEYLPQCLHTAFFDFRGFLVGTHLDNISTVFDHPYGGAPVDVSIFEDFGISDRVYTPPKSIRKHLFHKMPYKTKRKLRYWAERDWPLRPVFSGVYQFLRG